MNAITTDFIQYIPLEKIVYSRYQPRQTMDAAELEKLAQSILQNTMLQKPTARIQPDGCYELAFGHRRFEAYKILAAQDSTFVTMPLIIRELTDEQMFDLAWEENEERADLNPIDEGIAYDTWMREFNKTSKDAGLRFHTSEENIRAKVRLGKLPDPVKDQVREGKINETVARSLLQMQRVASEKVVTETAKKIASGNSEYNPEQVIEHTIDRLNNVVEFDKEGWSLDMKKFPNDLLPVLDQKTAKADEVNKEHLINPPACSACAFYTKVRGNHYCGLKACYQRKYVAWELYLINLTSKKLNIAVYDKEKDGGYVILTGYSDSNQKLFKSRQADLRLILKSATERYSHQWGFEGVNNDHIFVVATQSAMNKLIDNHNTAGKRSKGGKKTDKEKAEMRMMRVYRVRRLDLMWEYTAAVKSMFDSVPLNVLTNINRWENILMDDTIPEKYKHGNADGDFQRRALVWRLIKQDCSHYRRQSMTTILNAMQKRTGVNPPKALIQRAEEWDAEIKAAAEPKAVKK